MSFEQAQVLPVVIEVGFEQRTTVDGSAMDGEEIGVVGFVAGVGGLAKLLGGEGMDDARLQAGGRPRASTTGRVEWEVLDWNTKAIDFYDGLGARPMSGWTKYRWTSTD